jgi:NAD(P)-dependent dehydrogenase (short-subunit alcohol dehydrogenase family)
MIAGARQGAKGQPNVARAGAHAIDVVACHTRRVVRRARHCVILRLFENSYPGVLDEKVEPPEGFDSGSDAGWNTALATNLSSALLCSQTAYPEMVSTEGRKGPLISTQ